MDDGEKVKQEDLSHPLADSSDNPVWDGATIRLFGARNEIIAFQLIIEADGSGASDVYVEVSDLESGAYTIPGSESGPADPYDYRGRCVELFTEHYLHITSRSNNSWDADAAAPSDYYLGRVPDALIPFCASAGLGGAPFDIPPSRNQGVWVDIYIPRDAAAGTYTGTVTITEDSSVFQVIPLSLADYGFTLQIGRAHV